MDDNRNSLEILVNLIYLAKHNTGDAAAVEHYLSQAEEQVSRLVAISRQKTDPLLARPAASSAS
ncbi:hypothetical protein HDF16_005185 [Granulicella aggregans]|uniref:Uncharacterized protein n=1 Tax=Granulicella aggregans TaxID=474949 RepID=A0A7W7ZJ10_9BACT|nr:hypothetical protein [Granulicella aggregans]MBB5060449.1 hypothetical protein [Granulicella aggregans]